MIRRSVAARPAVWLVLAALAMPACANAQTPPQAEVEEADTLLARIVTRDPAACFSTVELRNPDLRPQQPTTPETVVPRRVVLAIDASGSMRASVGGQRKIDAAKTAAIRFLRGLGPDVETGLVVFGHRGTARADGKAASCAADGAELVVPPGPGQTGTAVAAVEALTANGWTPLASAIAAAGASFTPGFADGEQVVYVISDGLETCGGDPVAAARNLRRADIRAVVNIIGFDIPARERAALEAVSTAGAGTYLDARNPADLNRRLVERLENLHRENTSRLSASHALAVNNLATTHAISRLRLCTQHIIGTERIEMTRLIGIARRERRLDEEAAAAVERTIASRHQRLQEAVAEYVEALSSANAARAGEIRGDLERALQGLKSTRPPMP
jgi:Ca-activated chloride channel family protein